MEKEINMMREAAKKKVKNNSQFSMAFRQFKRNRPAIVGFVLFALIILLCVFAEYLTPYQYDAQDLSSRFAPISWAHPFGTDQFGRDQLTRILKGGQTSLLVASLAVAFAAVIGIILGSTAAFFGGVYELIVMRIVDTFMSIPNLMLAAGVSLALGSGITNSAIAIAMARVANMTRLMYANSLSIWDAEYLEAARANGVSKMRQVFVYVIPNCIAPLIVQISMSLGTCITSIASLSFLGLGVKPPIPEWGSILNVGRSFIRQHQILTIIPGAVIALTLIAVNLLGDGIRDALDPKLKR